MKRAAIGMCLLASTGGGCATPSRQAAIENAPVAVVVRRVDVTDVVSPFEAGGVVRARATALIASRVMAPITEIRVNPGDRVRRGATLVTLDARDLWANKERAAAALRSATETARAADADVRAAESAVVLARATHDRMAALHAKRSATTQELDQAVAALAGAEAQQGSTQARRAAADAARDAAQADTEVAGVTATYAVLSAPFDGLVTERRADPGSMATPGAPLVTLDDPATYHLEVQLDEARAALVEIGQVVSARLDHAPGAPDNSFRGRVAEIARVDPASHAFRVKIDLPPAASLHSGVFGRARFPGQARRALTVPASALIERGQLTFVYLVDGEGRARLRPISAGSPDHDRREVFAGLREGDGVVTNPPASLTDGARVTGERP